MPLIIANDKGHSTSLFYEDTGPPQSADDPYTTLIIVHGTAFHGQIFRRLLPLAPQHQLRLVVVNRRDYPGSSSYTDEELEQIRVDNAETHARFARARAAEFAQFIKCFVEKENVPKPSSDWKRGGIVLMAWSSGNGYTLPLLAYVDSIPERTREVVEPYLRSHIVFDVPPRTLGVPFIDYGFRLLTDVSLNPEERTRRFNEWVSAYFVHKSHTSRNTADLQLVPAEGSRMSTIQSMTAEEERETTHYAAVPRSEIGASTASPATYAERMRRALFDDALAKYWPRCGVDVVWCENSTLESVQTMWGVQVAREKADEEGIVGRPLRIIKMPGANHFPHWDEPEMTIEFFVGVIHT